jgi:hypothetical protein
MTDQEILRKVHSCRFDTSVLVEDVLAVLVSADNLGLLVDICVIISEYAVDRRYLRPFYKHQWLHMRDTQNNWCEARIIDLARSTDTDEGFIHFRYP